MLLSLLSKRYFVDDSRDSYGFTVRPQHIQTFREYACIYREEEEERSTKWRGFLAQQPKPTSASSSSSSEDIKPPVPEDIEQPTNATQTDSVEGNGSSPEQRPQNSQVSEKETEPLLNVTAQVNDTQGESVPSGENDDSTEKNPGHSQVEEKGTDPVQTVSGEKDDSVEQKPADCEVSKKDQAEHVPSSSAKVDGTHVESAPSRAAPTTQQAKSRQVKTWVKINPCLHCIEKAMSMRVKKRKNMKDNKKKRWHNYLPSIDEERFSEEPEDGDGDGNDNEDALNDNEVINDSEHACTASNNSDKWSPEPCFPWKELELLVQGGVPKELRGEVWQAFVGVRARRVERYYQDLLAVGSDDTDAKEHEASLGDNMRQQNGEKICDLPDKLKKQIEKDLPRTFPGHPALNDNGRDSLRRVLWAYARHNPSVGYCQAMNFFAGLFLLMMPEENAFWTLVGVIDEYFEGYFSQEMIESQVDQLVFEDLMRERFPKLVNHLDYLGVEVAWVSGSWFLSIFVNIIPWESVLRVWDVLLFEGNRVMLFRTALALMDLYGPALITTKDAGDAITLLQTLAGSTFDSSQLVLTACMGFLTVTQDLLEELQNLHRPVVLASMEERAKGSTVFKDPKGLATKLYSFKHQPRAIVQESKTEAGSGDKIDAHGRPDLDSHSASMEAFLQSITIDSEVDSLPDLQEQVVWLKVELCRLLEEKRSAVLRAEELESALMELVQEDNRRELSAKVEQLEQEVGDLKQVLADKKAAEQAMLQVLMKVEQEQRVTEDARRYSEQEAMAQRKALQALEEKYQLAMVALYDMEKRAVLAESMLEATIQYEPGKANISPPRSGHADSPSEVTKKAGLLQFSLGWRDRNKGKSSSDMPPYESYTDGESSGDHPK